MNRYIYIKIFIKTKRQRDSLPPKKRKERVKVLLVVLGGFVNHFVFIPSAFFHFVSSFQNRAVSEGEIDVVIDQTHLISLQETRTEPNQPLIHNPFLLADWHVSSLSPSSFFFLFITSAILSPYLAMEILHTSFPLLVRGTCTLTAVKTMDLPACRVRVCVFCIFIHIPSFLCCCCC